MSYTIWSLHLRITSCTTVAVLAASSCPNNQCFGSALVRIRLRNTDPELHMQIRKHQQIYSVGWLVVFFFLISTAELTEDRNKAATFLRNFTDSSFVNTFFLFNRRKKAARICIHIQWLHGPGSACRFWTDPDLLKYSDPKHCLALIFNALLYICSWTRIGYMISSW